MLCCAHACPRPPVPSPSTHTPTPTHTHPHTLQGELKFLDTRLVSGGAAAGAPGMGTLGPGMGPSGSSAAQDATLKTVLAHSKGGVSALVAHPHAPLLATGTTTQARAGQGRGRVGWGGRERCGLLWGCKGLLRS